MSFLEIFGRRLPIASVKRVDREFGARDNAWGGTPRVSTRARKRVLEFTTPLLAGVDAELWQRVLRGMTCEGRSFDTARNLYSSKGQGLMLLAQLPTIDSGLSADALPVYFRDTTNNVDRLVNTYQTGVLAGQSGSNYLTANQSSVETDTTGFTAVDGATLARVTTHKMYGTASLKCTTSGAVNAVRGGFYVEITSSGGTHEGFVYLRAFSGSPVVRVRLRNETTASEVLKTSITLSTAYWLRVECTGLASSNTNSLRLYVEEETADSSAVFVADGLHIGAGGGGGKWVTGGTAVNNSGAYLPLAVVNKSQITGRGFSVAFWHFAGVPGSIPISGDLFELQDASSDNRLTVRVASGSPPSLIAESRGSTTATATYANAAVGAGGWEHIVAAIDEENSLLRLFRNGAQVASASVSVATTKPTLANVTEIVFGSSTARALLADLLILPFGVSSATELYAAAQVAQLSLLPRLLVTGTAITALNESRLFMIGDCTEGVHQGKQVAGAWDPNARVLTGTLTEV